MESLEWGFDFARRITEKRGSECRKATEILFLDRFDERNENF